MEQGRSISSRLRSSSLALRQYPYNYMDIQIQKGSTGGDCNQKDYTFQNVDVVILKLMIKMVFLFILSVARTHPVSEQSFFPKPTPIIQPSRTLDAYTEESHTHELAIDSSIQLKLYQLKQAHLGQTLDQFLTKPDLYFLNPENCFLKQSSVQLLAQERLFGGQEQPINSLRQGNLIYVLSNWSVNILRIDLSKRSVTKEFSLMLDKGFGASQVVFFTHLGQVYLTNGKRFLLVNLKQRSLLDVVGFQELATGEQLVRIEDSSHFGQVLLLTNQKLYRYKFTQPTICRLESSPGWDLETPVFVDVKCNSSQVFLLEATRGLYAITQQGLLEPFPMTVPEDLRYTAMRIFNNTVEIIVQYDDRKYVAELILWGQTFYLNRLYDEVSDVKSITFLNQRILIVGQNQMYLTLHSVPQTMLLKVPNIQSNFFLNQGLDSLQMMEVSPPQSNLIAIGMGKHQIVLLEFQVSKPKLECSFEMQPPGLYSYLVASNTTSCSANGGLCTYYQFINFNVREPVGRRLNIVIFVMSVLVAIIGLFLAIGVALRFVSSRRAARSPLIITGSTSERDLQLAD